MKLGPTQKFPRGKLNTHDEGELRMAIGVKDKTVVVDFGKPIAWIGLDADTAERLAMNILKHVASIKGAN